MKRLLLVLALPLAPAVAAARQDPSPPPAAPAAPADTQAKPPTQARADVLAKFSAESRVKLEGILGQAKEKKLPQQPLVDRMSEGKAKGAEEGQIVSATGQLMARLETANRVMVDAGRKSPEEREITLGAAVLERGASEEQLGAVVHAAPSDRSLVVSFDVLTRLSERGLPVSTALAQVTAKLNARATDNEIASLTTGLGLKLGKPTKP